MKKIFDQISLGVVVTWPWGVVNAESEVIERLKIAAKNLNIKLQCITKDGFIVDEEFNNTHKKIKDKIDFVFTFHYEDVKLIDTFFYHVLWNPPRILLQYDNYLNYVKNIQTNDDYLVYDKRGMTDYLKTILLNRCFDLSGCSSLVPGFSYSSIIPCSRVNNKAVIFYCGMNWERFINKEARYQGFFSLLDESGIIELYGPVHSWDGYKSYKGTIPFDGTSILNKIHKCGVVLCLSSEYHYRASAVTNRIYEGCAAGAVIISDLNDFIKEKFGDSILYIDHAPKDPNKMYEQILHHFEWIQNNPDLALEKAKKAQKIFINNFTFEKQLIDIISNHNKRKKIYIENFCAKNKDNTVVAIMFLDCFSVDFNLKTKLKRQYNNINCQKVIDVKLVAICDSMIYDELSEFCSEANLLICLEPYNFFDSNNNKVHSRGEALYSFYSRNKFAYFMILDGNEIMFSYHATQLVRSLEEKKDHYIAYSANFSENTHGERAVHFYRNMTWNDLLNFATPNSANILSGIFLFKRNILDKLHSFVYEYLDCYLVNALILNAEINFNLQSEFNSKLSCGFIQEKSIDTIFVLEKTEEQRFIHGLVQYNLDKFNYKFQNNLIQSPNSYINLKDNDASRHMLRMMKKYFCFRVYSQVLYNYIRLMIPGLNHNKIKSRINNLKNELLSMKEV